jgi:stage II sporulation protein GA (sporulation sigma-E factor processing peptidase)
MVVYIEYVFLDNFLIDIILISLARKSLRLQSKKPFLLLSATVGALVACILPVLKLGVAVSFALKMPIGLLIILCSGKFRGFGELVKCFENEIGSWNVCVKRGKTAKNSTVLLKTTFFFFGKA